MGPSPETLLNDSERWIRISLGLIRVFIRVTRTWTPITNRETISNHRPSIFAPGRLSTKSWSQVIWFMKISILRFSFNCLAHVLFSSIELCRIDMSLLDVLFLLNSILNICQFCMIFLFRIQCSSGVTQFGSKKMTRLSLRKDDDIDSIYVGIGRSKLLFNSK